MTENLSLATARRIALAAQGFADARPSGAIDRRHLRRVLDRTGLLQIDSVNVLIRAHYLPAYSRVGAYPRSLLEDAAWGRRKALFEYWAHEASLLPLELHPFFRWRMARADQGLGTWGRVKPYAGERRPEAEAILQRITAEGPLAASDLEGTKGAGGWWGWSDAKTALEWLFWTGRITTAKRRSSFERVYDLTERVLPSALLNQPTPREPDAHRQLLRIAARALGIATAGDLRDYFRLSPEDAKPRIAELVETGELVPDQEVPRLSAQRAARRLHGWRQRFPATTAGAACLGGSALAVRLRFRPARSSPHAGERPRERRSAAPRPAPAPAIPP